MAVFDPRPATFLRLSWPDWAGGLPNSPHFRQSIRQTFNGPIFAAGADDAAKAEQLIGEHLIDAGVGIELRREVYLCALFSQLDEILGESLDAILHRIPLSERVYEAAAENTGPYAPILQMARALENCDASAVRQLCEDHDMVLEDVNRTLLRVLSAQTMPRAA